MEVVILSITEQIILEADKSDIDLIEEYRQKGMLADDFFPIMTYSAENCGYPTPNHGEMIARPWSGTDEKRRLLSGNGKWCKVSDVRILLLEMEKSIRKKIEEELRDS